MDLCKEGTIVPIQESLDDFNPVSKARGQFTVLRLPADQNEDPPAGAHYEIDFLGSISLPVVPGDRNPAALGDDRYPLYVGRERLEMIVMNLDGQASPTEGLGNGSTSVPIGKEDVLTLLAHR